MTNIKINVNFCELRGSVLIQLPLFRCVFRQGSITIQPQCEKGNRE